MILDIEACYPGWAQVVLDVFCHANSLPCVSNLAVEDKDAVCAGESVHVGQVFAGKAQVNGLDKPAGACVDRLVDGGEHRVI